MRIVETFQHAEVPSALVSPGVFFRDWEIAHLIQIE
jgi:hypothetical protein